VVHLVPKAMSKDIRIEILGEEKVMVYAEPVSIAILISNLVDNAIRYTPEGGEVIVNIDTLGNDDIVLSVADTGPGIDEESLSRVYDRFYRVLGSSGSGCGLGLSIVKRIADLHQLRLDIKNKAEEPGLIISVHFPKQ
jgi:signal transduction histidine kinase